MKELDEKFEHDSKAGFFMTKAKTKVSINEPRRRSLAHT